MASKIDIDGWTFGLPKNAIGASVYRNGRSLGFFPALGKAFAARDQRIIYPKQFRDFPPASLDETVLMEKFDLGAELLQIAVQEQMKRDEALVRRMLAHWVSDVGEPVLVMDHNHTIIGLGPEEPVGCMFPRVFVRARDHRL